MSEGAGAQDDRSKGGFLLKRRDPDGHILETASLAELFNDWHGSEESWLFIAPHDDDIVMSAGILLQTALAQGVAVSILVTTDGSMGYCDRADRGRIVETRRQETLESFSIVGLDDVEWLGFPDCNLSPFLGRRLAQKGDPFVVEGFTGLQNAYTYELRRRRPTRLFLASGEDLHPDHRQVFQEARISIFHAGGAIWPELGTPLNGLPAVYELAVYCAFSGDPEFLIEGREEHLERKLQAIGAYRSQRQIERLVAELREAGPVEYLHRSDLGLYSPAVYRRLFNPEG